MGARQNQRGGARRRQAVLVDFEFPPPSISPIYAKPVSYLMIAALALTFSGFELARPHMAKFTKSQMSFIKLIAFVGIALAAYEVFYNFAIWTAEIATNSLLGVRDILPRLNSRCESSMLSSHVK